MKKTCKNQKRPMTHLGVEFVKTSLLICLWPNEPKNKIKMDQSPSTKTCEKYMRDV